MKIIGKIISALIFIIIMSIILNLFAVIFIQIFIFTSNLLGLQHSLGIDTQASKNYDSVSGYLPIVVASLGFSGILVTIWHHLECHVQSPENCHRLGHPVPGTSHRACHAHNPASKHSVGEKITVDHINKAHFSTHI